MKSTYEKKPPHPELTYPCVRMYEDGDFAVLFQSLCHGTVVWSTCKDRPLGVYAEDWTPADDSCWKPLVGRIILEG